MADTWYNDAGTFRKAKQLWYNDAGTWRQAKQLWYNDAGTWRKVFSGFTVQTGGAFNTSNPSAAQVTFVTDGSVTTTDSTTYAWGLPTTTGAGAAYWVYFTAGSGTGTVAGTTGSWLQLSSNRSIGINSAGAGQVRSKNFTWQIATDAAGATVVASGTISTQSDNT